MYWGVESGSDDVLSLVNKGYTQKEILKAGRMLREADIKASVMIMPGLGGIKFNDKHIKDTTDIMVKIYPRYITFMSVDAPETEYEKQIKSDPENRQLTREELVIQIENMRDRYMEKARNNPLKRKNHSQIAAFDRTVTPLADNPITFNEQI